MFVSDANAPVPLYDVDAHLNDDEWWSDKENALSVAKSMFLYQDKMLFDELKSATIHEDI